jgi:radical SAM superfamily enzyme YgiQ (UPF0313 family)
MPSVSEFIENAKRAKINADEPLGLAYISAWIRKKMPQVQIEIYDNHIISLRYIYKNKRITKEKILNLLKKKISQYKPNIVGIGALYHMNADLAHLTAKIVKKINKKTIVIMGGIYPTASGSEVLKDKNIDFIIPGEGEIPFQDFLEFQLGKKRLNELKSIGYRLEGSKKIEFRRESPFIKNIDEIGFPDRTTLPIGKYSIWGRTFVDRFYHPNTVVAAVQPTRGCPFQCTFCCGHIITSRIYRTRNIKNVIKEMKYLKNKYGIEVFTFNDENANANPNWWINLYDEIIKSKLNIKWCHSGGFYVGLMNDEFIEKAIKSGLIMFTLAIESGSPKILRLVKKTEKIIENAPKVIRKIRKIAPNMYITGFFICGFPFETHKDIKTTINFAKNLDLDWTRFNIFTPFPGSELYTYCLNHQHLSVGNFSRKNLRFLLTTRLKKMPIPPKKLENIVYLANLDLNFVNSRTLRTNNLEQAARDYEHVVNIAPDHVLAHWCLAKAYTGLNRPREAEKMTKKALNITKKNKTQARYLKHFNISLKKT